MPERRLLSTAIAGLLVLGGCTAKTTPTAENGPAHRAPIAANPTAKTGQPKAKPPVDVPGQMSKVKQFLEAGDLGGAARVLDEVVALDPTNPKALYLLADVSQRQAFVLPRSMNASLYLKAGEAARRRLALPVELSPIEKQNLPDILYNETCTFAVSGDAARAIASLSQAFEAGLNRASLVDTDPELDSLRKLPEFQKVQLQIERRAVADQMAALKPYPYDFKLKDLDGKPTTLADVKGKLTMIDFWGTWCPPCRKEVPHFVELLKRYGDKGLKIVGLNYESRPDEEASKLIREFAKEHGITYTCLIGDQPARDAVDKFEGFPTTLLIDETGKVRLRLTGYQSLAALDVAVNAMLEVQKPALPVKK